MRLRRRLVSLKTCTANTWSSACRASIRQRSAAHASTVQLVVSAQSRWVSSSMESTHVRREVTAPVKLRSARYAHQASSALPPAVRRPLALQPNTLWVVQPPVRIALPVTSARMGRHFRSVQSFTTRLLATANARSVTAASLASILARQTRRLAQMATSSTRSTSFAGPALSVTSARAPRASQRSVRRVLMQARSLNQSAPPARVATSVIRPRRHAHPRLPAGS